MLDVIIIGGGITGAMIAHELSAYALKVAVLEKEMDAANGVTLANSAIIHSGYDPEPGTLKARLNARGNALYTELCEQLHVPLKRIGSLTVALSEGELETLKALQERAKINGVPVEWIDRDRLLAMEPGISPNALAALLAPTAGIIDPWEMTYALLEHAADNGVDWVPGAEVTAILPIEGGYRVETKAEGSFDACFIINAAGLYSDKIHNMVAEPEFTIKPRRGEYFILDKSEGHHVNHVIFPCPTNRGKGVLISPTIHGNLIVGPTSEDAPDREAVETTMPGMEKIRREADRVVSGIAYNKSIRNFAGLRPSTDVHDFIIGYVPGQVGFIDVAGIDSPGLASAPAVAEYVVELLSQKRRLERKATMVEAKPAYVRFAQLTEAEKQVQIQKDPSYGHIICRCEMVTEGEILECIRRKIGARSIKGIKKRVRPGSGRCQGGFCGPRLVEILARELEIDPWEVLYDGPGSEILTGRR